MAISPYIRKLRSLVGPMRLLLPSVSVQLFDEQGRLLLVRLRDNGQWSTPGGLIEPDERPGDAAARELWEETGLIFRPERVLGFYAGLDCVVTYPNGDEVQYAIVAVGGVVTGGALRADDDETIDVKYWTKQDALTLPLAPWLRAHLDLVYEQAAHGGLQPVSWMPPDM